MKKKAKTRTPAPVAKCVKSVSDAIRISLLEALGTGVLNARTLQAVARIADSGRTLLAALDPDQVQLPGQDRLNESDEDSGLYQPSPILTSNPNVETFGAKTLREIVAVAREFTANRVPAPDAPATLLDLVEAIGRAQSLGLTDVVASLQVELKRRTPAEQTGT